MRPAVPLILVLNVVLFAAELWLQGSIIESGALRPLGHGFQPWQLLSHAFLHVNAIHLAANMLALWTFGRSVENAMGFSWFLRLYGISIVIAACTQLGVSAVLHQSEPMIGASGGVFGVLAAFGLLFPRRRIFLALPPMILLAWIIIVACIAIELLSGVEDVNVGIAHVAHVAHVAHLGGVIGGVVTVRLWRSERKDLFENTYEGLQL